MRSFLFALLIAGLSPIWPLGQNPLPGDPYVIVNKETNRLAFIHENKVAAVYEVATGKTADLTPEGEFSIIVKARNPYYRKKDIEGGSPDNPLGPRWIGFDAGGTDGRMYGIHGTNREHSIGKYMTSGCIRMHNKDVIHLFDQLPIGTKVLITKEKRPFAEMAAEKHALTKKQASP
ncbi:L,D-transpeptidase [Bacillus swezeyi]|uniref:L,D-transpeptidase n=1 Tax=Bacillus swezeyi TaxID=1925020 RepID=UPI0027DCD522|nr:L,D-transpeptidase [Bacillus swezeyi]MED1739652.1 L,D-transpeptidase [Bacillus swezeyi]